MITLLCLAFAFTSGKAAFAGAQVGTVTVAQGQVTLFTHPGKTMDGPPPHALFEGLYYSVSDAHVGDRLEFGNIIRTAPSSKARVIYDNGDQFYVAPSTAFAITWDEDSEKGKAEMKLSYGGARGVIAKGGPRSRFVIRTKTAVMGVRGTDFFIGVNPDTGATETATLRGSVAVASASTPDAAPVEVKAGEAASVEAPLPVQAATPALPPAPIEVRKASAQELGLIQKASEVKVGPATATPEAAKLVVEKLETQAQIATLNDIRQANPELAAKFDKNPDAVKNIDQLNQASLAELIPKAPKTVAERSVISDLNDAQPVVPTSVAEATPEEKPRSRSGGFRLLRGEFAGLIATQSQGANSRSFELAWTPRLQFGSWGWIGLRDGASLLKGQDSTFPMFEQAFVFGVRIIGSFSLEALIGVQEWADHGAGLETGLNLVWFPEARSFGVVERWYIGIANVGGQTAYIGNGSSGSTPGSGSTCITGCSTQSISLNATLFRAGVGL